MKSSEYRSKYWSDTKRKALRRIYNIFEKDAFEAEITEELVSQAIQDYIDSNHFEEDACDYCREQGWREPD